MSKKKIIVGNWKMNPGTRKEAEKIFSKFLQEKPKSTGVTTVICSPFIYINDLVSMYKGSKIFFGGQDCFTEEAGSYTGEISASMLKSLKARFVILGHSERRKLGEANEFISKKVLAARKAGLHVVLCVGENERKEDGSHLREIKKQVTESLNGISRSLVKDCIIAYEPVWAIGKGKKAMEPHEIHQMSLYIKKALMEIYGKKTGSEISIIYGGSSNASNAAAIVQNGGVDGLLPGRASLDPKEFAGMIEAVSKCT